MTISGDNLKKSIVINTKIGVSLKELIDNFIEIIDPLYDVYLNGYLKGIKVLNIDEIIITKEINTIVINKKEIEEESECINCGLCNYICPAKIKLKEVIMEDYNA